MTEIQPEQIKTVMAVMSKPKSGTFPVQYKNYNETKKQTKIQKAISITCDECEKVFTRRVHLRTHKRIHIYLFFLFI